MRAKELIDTTVEKVKNHESEMILVLPTKRNEGERRRLAGRNSPLGTVLSQEEVGTVCAFDPMDVFLFLLANEAITLERTAF